MSRGWESLNEGWERLIWARERYCRAYKLKQSAASGARVIGISKDTYAQYERNPHEFQRAAKMTPDRAQQFGGKLKTSWRWLLFGDGTPDDDIKNPLLIVGNEPLTHERDHDSTVTSVALSEIGIPLIGAIGASADWTERGKGYKVLPVAVLRGQGENACVGLTITEGVPGYRSGHILIVDTERRQHPGDEVVILRRHGKVVKYRLLIANEVVDGRASTYLEADGGAPWVQPDDEELENIGAVAGTHIPSRD